MTAPLLVAENVSVVYRPSRAFLGAPDVVEAVRGADFKLAAGETLAVVGESGAGKSTLARAVLGLVPLHTGRVEFRGDLLFSAEGRGPRGRALRRLRRGLQIVFQDPAASLDARMLVGDSVAEGLLVHGLAAGAEIAPRVASLLESVGLDPELRGRLPHELSGGQRQRVAIARALAVEPDVLVLDEPTASLDPEIRRHLVDLLRELRVRRGLAYLFVSHDLGVVREIADRVAVMENGLIVEVAARDDLYDQPKHPYTEALLRAAAGDSAWVDEN